MLMRHEGCGFRGGTESGGSQWHNRMQWARQRLINHGLLDGSERGFWRLTPEGLERAGRVANKYANLKQ